MATVKKSQKYQTGGGIVSTVKKAAAKVADKVSTAVKNAAPKTGGNPYKKVADLSKTRGQRFLSKDKEEMKSGGKMKKAQSGASVKKASKPMGMNFDKKSYDKLPSYDAKIKADTTKKAKSGGKMKKGC